MSEMQEQGKNIPDEKKLKALSGMYKDMRRATGAASALGGIFGIMEMLEPLLKPLEIVLTIIGNLFMVMASEILPPLMVAFQPLFDFLIELTPLFQEIGILIGQLVAEYLPPIILLLMQFFKALMPLIPPLINIIGLIIQIALKLLPVLITVFTNIANIIIAIFQPILSWLASLSPSQLGLLFYTFGLGISTLYGLLQGGPVLAAIYGGLWAGIMSPLLSMQAGGIAMRPVVAEVGHGGEAVVPLDEWRLSNQELIYATEDNGDRLDRLIISVEASNRRRGAIR